MTSIEVRLKRLEAAHRSRVGGADSPESMRRARQADLAGTASVEQYGLLYAEDVSFGRKWLSAASHASLAREQAGLPSEGPQRALAFPPDNDLPGYVVDGLRWCRYLATSTVEERQWMDRHKRFYGSSYTPEGRRAAALRLLILGDDEALTMRRLIWTTEGGRWALTADVHQLGNEAGFTIEEAAEEFALDSGYVAKVVASLPFSHVDESSCPPTAVWMQDPHDESYWLPFAATAAAIKQFGLVGPCKSPTWSDQVRSGHDELAT